MKILRFEGDTDTFRRKWKDSITSKDYTDSSAGNAKYTYIIADLGCKNPLYKFIYTPRWTYSGYPGYILLSTNVNNVHLEYNDNMTIKSDGFEEMFSNNNKAILAFSQYANDGVDCELYIDRGRLKLLDTKEYNNIHYYHTRYLLSIQHHHRRLKRKSSE